MKLLDGRLSIIALVILLGACRQDAAPLDEASRAVPATPPARSAPAQAAQTRAAETRPHVATAAQQGHPDMLTLADEVAALGDAQALALAAMLRDGAMMGAGPESTVGPKTPPTRMDGKVREWIDEAQRRAPDEVTVLVLAVYLERYDDVRRQALVARWRALEPQNLVPLFHATLPETALFEAAAATTVYDSHYDDVLRLFIDTLLRASPSTLARVGASQQGLTREEQAGALALVFWLSSSSPAFQRIAAPCRADGQTAVRQQQCRRIAEVLLRRSDVLIAEMLGGNMISRLSGIAAEKAEVEAYEREGQWLMSCIGQLEQRNPRMLMRRYTQLIRGGQHVTERAVMRQLGIESGFPPSPPAGWQRGTP
jgi:hypothetical protein